MTASAVEPCAVSTWEAIRPASLGDNFLYGGDDLTVDVTQAAWLTTACENRHLEFVAAIPWPSGSVARSPAPEQRHWDHPNGRSSTS
jgi:hypothetical protein